MTTDRTAEVLDRLRAIVDPDLGRDIVSLGFVKDLRVEAGAVSFTVELTTPACPVRAQFQQACEEAVSRLPWVRRVDVRMSARPHEPREAMSLPGLAGVEHIVAVSSCKGGVGKSTVAVNLAYSLAQAGARVGLFDADVYGPSLPTLVSIPDPQIYGKDEMLLPLERDGVRLMSFGHVSAATGGGAAIMRGPMVSQVVNQLLTGTDWGALHYLVVDLPPGTGDIQLTLTQIVPLTAAVIVTTPQDLSFVDVVKGIQMFDKVKVPAIAVVENMSHFTCDQCGKKHHVFGHGARRKIVEEFGIPHAFEIPLHPDVSRLGDAGRPLVLEQPDGEVAKIYRALTDAVVREISRLQFGGRRKPAVAYEPDRGILVTLPSGATHAIEPAALRRRCRCAACVDEMTGEALLKPEQVAPGIYPTGIQPMGNYAVAVTWSDGHASSIYPHEMLVPDPA
jgi:Mrp family chromosome partitioning ATPase/DUF971 family protein